jgi:FXSXX-COOH protein
VPTSGHETNETGQAANTSEAAGEVRAGETGLLIMSRLSLEDLAGLDDSVVANVLRDLVKRGRCGAGPGERYSNHDSTI